MITIIAWFVLSVLVGSLHVRFSLLCGDSVLARFIKGDKRYPVAEWFGHSFAHFLIGIVVNLILVAITPITFEMFAHDWRTRMFAASVTLCLNGALSALNSNQDAREDADTDRDVPSEPYGGGTAKFCFFLGLVLAIIFFGMAIWTASSDSVLSAA